MMIVIVTNRNVDFACNAAGLKHNCANLLFIIILVWLRCCMYIFVYICRLHLVRTPALGISGCGNHSPEINNELLNTDTLIFKWIIQNNYLEMCNAFIASFTCLFNIQLKSLDSHLFFVKIYFTLISF